MTLEEKFETHKRKGKKRSKKSKTKKQISQTFKLDSLEFFEKDRERRPSTTKITRKKFLLSDTYYLHAKFGELFTFINNGGFGR